MISIAARAAEVKPGSNVVVVGTRGVGLNLIQAARLAGAERIIAMDLLDNKLEFAREMGSYQQAACAMVRLQHQPAGRRLTRAVEVPTCFERTPWSVDGSQ